MRLCPACGKSWPAPHAMCPEDGVKLVDRAKLGAEATVAAPSQKLEAPRPTVTAHPRSPSSRSPSAPPKPVAKPALGELAAGMTVGEYEITGKLGEGGMGTVYAARHPFIGKRAAVKVISEALCTDAEAVERFVQEARAVNQIGHPNIVDVFSFGTLADGRCYFVMEWLQGQSLAGRLQQGRLPVREAVEILDPICRALEAAHERGIIHRDLKPDNVFVVPVRGDRPLIKLLDFGIAKLAGSDDSRVQRTRTGMMMGTPLYMSPEQARARGLDARTDIYSLGVVAYEMLLGRPPFVSDSAMEIVAAHLHQAPPPPSTLRPDLPAPLERMLLDMLNKDPARRPGLALIREQLAALSGPAHTQRVAPPVPTVKGAAGTRSRGVWIVAACALFAIGAGTVLGVGRRHKGEPMAAAPAAAPAVAPGTLVVRANVADARIEVDGRVVAAAAASARVALEKPGRHTVAVSAPGRDRFETSIEVEAGDKVELPVQLARTAPAPVPSPPAPVPVPAAAPPARPPPRAAKPTRPAQHKAVRHDDVDAPLDPFER